MTESILRQRAKLCLDRANTLLTHDDEVSARYACLELRFAIEYIVYQTLQEYLPELHEEAIGKKWHPRTIIEEMLKVDPLADKTSIIQYGQEKIFGVPAVEMKLLGEDRRISINWIKDYYHALGYFLHAPAPFKIVKGDIPTAEKIRAKANEVAAEIKHLLATNIYGVNLKVSSMLKCDCGRIIDQRSEHRKIPESFVCPGCSAVWDVVKGDPVLPADGFTVMMRKTEYTCVVCRSIQSVGVHMVKENNVIECTCGARAKVVLCLKPLGDMQPDENIEVDAE